MEEVERHISPDGMLTLLVLKDAGGELSVGFSGGTWHTHPDLLASWLGVPEATSVDRFIDALKLDKLPIIMSGDGGLTNDPWVSDALSDTLRQSGSTDFVLRYWSGKAFDASALE